MIIDTLDTAKKELLLRHLELVIEKNKTLNLTRIDDVDKGILLHIEDSLSCLDEFSNQKGLFLDIGTGGGFPGIPLGVVSGRPGILIDSVKKKANAVQEIINELGLGEQLQAMGIRSEELVDTHRDSFNSVVVRAVSSLPVIEELATPLLKDGGTLIALRGREDKISIDEAKRVGELFGLEFQTNRSFSLNNEFDRNICVFRKVANSQISLPRRPGMAQKRPYR